MIATLVVAAAPALAATAGGHAHLEPGCWCRRCPLIVARPAVLPHFPSTHNFVVDPYKPPDLGWLFGAARSGDRRWPKGLAQRPSARALVLAVLAGRCSKPMPRLAGPSSATRRDGLAAHGRYELRPIVARVYGLRSCSRRLMPLGAPSAKAGSVPTSAPDGDRALTQALRPVALPWGAGSPARAASPDRWPCPGLRRVPLVRGLVGVTAP